MNAHADNLWLVTTHADTGAFVNEPMVTALDRFIARYGKESVEQWLHKNGCPWDEQTCIWAAGGGQLNCLQWAYKNGCPWDEYTCLKAEYYRHIECLKYARENGCPKYAHENGCPE